MILKRNSQATTNFCLETFFVLETFVHANDFVVLKKTLLATVVCGCMISEKPIACLCVIFIVKFLCLDLFISFQLDHYKTPDLFCGFRASTLWSRESSKKLSILQKPIPLLFCEPKLWCGNGFLLPNQNSANRLESFQHLAI